MPHGVLAFDERGRSSLDGEWELLPGDHRVEDVSSSLSGQAIQVPGLWEAQGHLELDGVAWYRKRFRLGDAGGWWTLCFGAVMDTADVYLNGQLLGSHDNAFTPFEVDPSAALLSGDNVLAVRVTDPAVDDPGHLRSAHGKQGWANHIFPSRPSLYMTYGGIWQSVVLRRHGPVVVADVFVNADPDDLVVTVELANRAGSTTPARLGVRTVGVVVDEDLQLAAGEQRLVRLRLGPTVAAHWRPQAPVLHDCLADVVVGGTSSDGRVIRYGLRTVRVEGTRLLVDGEPYRMKGALVQGFRADELYAEGSRRSIEEEVRAAQAMGFNALRLHIKAFHPAYLDVCDELGMLLHCDIPVAEPVAHEEMGDPAETLLARRSVDAVQQQIRRDRNHPSVVLWSLMNELCLDRPEARSWDRYERFARALVRAARAVDPTRPVIENEWVEPSPERVFEADVLTAHWYGRLHSDYLDDIEAKATRWADVGRPLLVTEFGDWGLPDMKLVPEPPFWDTREVHAAGLAETLWPGTIGRFVVETQRYQGLSDRLQAEVFRRHNHIGGYCLTELTDVPHELNGLLDLHRRPKPIAVAEMTRANQVVLPMLRLDSLVVVAGQLVSAPIHVANDGPALEEVEIEARFGDAAAPVDIDQLLALDTSFLPGGAAGARFGESVAAVRVTHLAAHRATQVGQVALLAPDVPGSHDLVLRLRVGRTTVAENRYPMHVVAEPASGVTVRLMGGGASGEALERIGARIGEEGPTVVGEGELDERAGRELRSRLQRGETAVVMAQGLDAGPHYPVPAVLAAVGTAWGSSVFHFTTDHGGLPSLPRASVLVAEDSTIQARSVIVTMGSEAFPDTPVVIAYKPVPGAITGTVVGAQQVGAGRFVFCQYRLGDRAAKGDPAARALLADAVRWAAVPRPLLERQSITKEDGRSLTFYRRGQGLAQ